MTEDTQHDAAACSGAVASCKPRRLLITVGSLAAIADFYPAQHPLITPPKANQALAKLPLNISLDDHVDFDLGLLAPPTDTASYLTTQHKGEFFFMKDPASAPFATPPITMPASLPRMMYVWVTTFLADSAVRSDES